MFYHETLFKVNTFRPHYLLIRNETCSKLLVSDFVKDVRDRSAIMVCKVKFGAKILPVYSPFNIKVK